MVLFEMLGVVAYPRLAAVWRSCMRRTDQDCRPLLIWCFNPGGSWLRFGQRQGVIIVRANA